VLEFVRQFLLEEGVADERGCYALWAEGTFLNETDHQALPAIPGLKFEVTRELAADARIGISQMQWALADTGTLVQDSSAIEERLVSSLTTIHIAIAPTAGLLPDMPTLLSKVHPKDCAYLAMITGPSRTADIERVLTIGVHGPERLIIIFCDALGGTN